MKHIKDYHIFESASELKLYHGSTKEFEIGFVLKSRPKGYTTLPDVKRMEDLFEKYRPEDKISRRNCVFMVNDIDLIDPAGGYLDHVYLVEPIGEVEKSDLAWYTEVDILMSETHVESDLVPLIMKYWDGEPYTGSNYSLFEYRAKSAKVLKEI